MIAVDGLSHRYPGMERDALHEVDFHVPRGSLAGLVGPNGAGKSTLLAVLNGVIPVQHGRVRVAGRAPGDRGRLGSASSLVPQDYAFYPTLTGRENLAFFAGVHGLSPARWRERLDYCVGVTRLAGVLDRQAGTYSGGLQRRLNLALGLINLPEILYLDEPTVGVDAESRQFIIDAIAALRRDGTTIVYTSHYMEEVESLCDRLTVIDRGRTVATGPIETLLAELGGTSMQIRLHDADAAAADDCLARWSPERVDARTLRLAVHGTDDVAAVVRALAEGAIAVDGIRYGVERLEDVYLHLLAQREDDA